MANAKKRGLGKGLDALIGGANMDFDTAQAAKASEPAALPDGTQLLLLDPREISPNPKQPRHEFHEEALQELAASLKRDGMQEPVIVRRVQDKYELVSGERRVRASVMADLEQIPAICRKVSDKDMLKLGLIENIQREDLNPVETAVAYKELMDEFLWTQEELAQEVGKNRSTVANMLRLLNLPEAVRAFVSRGELSMGHARALLALDAPDEQIRLARKTVKQGLSVRQVEKLAAAEKSGGAAPPPAKDPNLVQIEDDLRRKLGAKVALKHQQGGAGRIEIQYSDLDELERLLALLR